MKPEDVAKQYDEAIGAALRAVNDVETRYNTALERLTATPAQTPGAEYGPPVDNPAYKQVADQVKELEGSVAKAREQYTILLRQKAEGLNRAAQDANLPAEQKAKLEADAKQSLAQADEANARAALARAQAGQVGATNDIQRQQAGAAVTSAQASLQNAQASLQDANTRVAELAARAPLYAAQAASENAGANLTTEQAATAARLNRQAPTDAQAATANQNAVDLGTANVARTQQLVNKDKFGTLADLQAYAQEQAKQIAAGLLAPDQAARALQARIAGTDDYTATQAAEKAAMDRANMGVTQRGQDSALAGTKASTYGSVTTSGLNTFAGLNNTVDPGSDAAGMGFIGLQRQMKADLASAPFNAPPQVAAPALPPMLQPFAGGQPPPPTAPPAVGPGPVSPVGGVTINIGGGHADPMATGIMGTPGAAPAGGQPGAWQLGGMPGGGGPPGAGGPTGIGFLDKMRPAGPEDVQRLYGRTSGMQAA